MMASIATSIEIYDRVSAPINNILGGLNKLIYCFESVDSSMDGAFDSKLISQAKEQIQQATAQMVEFGNETDKNRQKQNMLNDSVGGLEKKIMGVVGAYASLQGIQKIINLSDEYTRITARLNIVTGSLEETEALQDKVFAAAQRSRASYGDMANDVAKLRLRTGEMFTDDEAIAFTETLNKMYTIAGTAQTEQAGATQQLIQALSSGVLRGEEFNSVFENAPNVMMEVAEYMGKPIGSLREMAAEGQITGDIVKKALLDATGDISKQFEQIPMTWADVWTTTMNKLYMMSQPILEVINWLANNWSILEPIVVGLATAVGLYTAALLVNKGIQVASTIAKTISTIASIAHGAAITQEMIATTGMTKAQLAFNAALYASPITWVLLIIIAIVAAIYTVIAIINKLTGKSISATGVIVGALMTAVAFIWNLFLGLLDIVLACVNWMWNKWAMFANFFANLFNDPVGSIIHLFGDMADNILGILESIAKALDKLFGSNLAGAVQGWRSGLDSMIEEAANKYGNGSYEKVMEEINLSSESLGLKRWGYGDAYNTGYNWGSEMEASITGALDDELLDNVAATAENTGKSADSLDITSEDLKYLRDIAETEAINKFTTAEIKVDMTNNNNINSNMDLDGVVDYLTNGVNEAMEKAAEGVHE